MPACSPARIYRIYQELAVRAPAIVAAAGDGQVSGTVRLLLEGDRDRLLGRWAEEMAELAGVLDGSHDDPYELEATQCFYWASLYAVTGGHAWAELDPFVAATEPVPGALAATAAAWAAAGAAATPAPRLFGLWRQADATYRTTARLAPHLALDEIMGRDLAEMATRAYLVPILAAVP